MTYASERGVATHVTAVEYRDDMPNVFASCDLVVDASWAGTGITGTIREAMAMRKPVIATDCGGNRELVSSPEVGWLIPAKEVRAAGARDRRGDRRSRRAASAWPRTRASTWCAGFRRSCGSRGWKSFTPQRTEITEGFLVPSVSLW